MTLLTGKLSLLWNNIFPGGLLPLGGLHLGDLPKASHSRENNTKRANTQIKQESTFVAIFLPAISISGQQWFGFVKEYF